MPSIVLECDSKKMKRRIFGVIIMNERYFVGLREDKKPTASSLHSIESVAFVMRVFDAV